MQIPLVISDYLMPQMKGDELLKHIHGKSPLTKKIMLTGHATIEGVINAIQNANLYRYLSKPWQHEDFKLTVTEAVNRYLQDQDLIAKNQALEKLTQEQAKLIENLRQNEAHLQKLNWDLKIALTTEKELREITREQEEANRVLTTLSMIDGLTGIANRRHFDETLEYEWERAKSNKQPLGLSIVDVDFFKMYNDHYGHLAGDDCLRQVAQFLKDNLRREGDLVARYGGEEFAFICPGINLSPALSKAQSLCQALENNDIQHEMSPFQRLTVIPHAVKFADFFQTTEILDSRGFLSAH